MEIRRNLDREYLQCKFVYPVSPEIISWSKIAIAYTNYSKTKTVVNFGFSFLNDSQQKKHSKYNIVQKNWKNTFIGIKYKP